MINSVVVILTFTRLMDVGNLIETSGNNLVVPLGLAPRLGTNLVRHVYKACDAALHYRTIGVSTRNCTLTRSVGNYCAICYTIETIGGSKGVAPYPVRFQHTALLREL